MSDVIFWVYVAGVLFWPLPFARIALRMLDKDGPYALDEYVSCAASGLCLALVWPVAMLVGGMVLLLHGGRQ